MKWIETKVIFSSDNKIQAAELISQIFHDLGLTGVVIEDPDDEPSEGWGDGAVRPDHDAVIGFWADNEFSEKKRLALEDSLRQLQQHTRISTRIVCRTVDDEDWSESWKEFFWPEKISDRITVKPTWREYSARPDEIILEIDPGMAFGTGTHPTTSLCIRMIETCLQPGQSFLDIGTGSGILMIAAAKLGAAELFGVDIDAVAVEIAEKNLRLNKVHADRFALATGNLVDVVPQKFDLVTANILSEVIVRLLDDIDTVLKKGGTLICSGIIADNREKVIRKMAETGFEILEVSDQDEWVAIAAKRK
jgi:ribosomal protein L11 methyltransferase